MRDESNEPESNRPRQTNRLLPRHQVFPPLPRSVVLRSRFVVRVDEQVDVRMIIVSPGPRSTQIVNVLVQRCGVDALAEGALESVSCERRRRRAPRGCEREPTPERLMTMF